jgi:RNA polymerase sigma-70 factor (ECF subfamily)
MEDPVTPDAELVRRSLAGEPSAFEELVRRWAAPVAAFCHAKVGRWGVGEDLAQEALLRAFRALGTLSEPEKFGPWLRGIALRACLDWLKAKERTQVNFSALAKDGCPEELLESPPDDAGANLERGEEIARMMREVEALPEELREVLFLFYYKELKYQEIARLLGVSSATVNVRLTKARTLLRRRLDVARR